MNKVYRVVGSTGAYEDFHEWTAKVFKDKKKAKAYKKECEAFVASMMVPVKHMDGSEYPKYYRSDYHKDSPDPYISINYTGTDYEIEEMEVL